MYLFKLVFIFFLYLPRSKFAGLHGSSIFSFWETYMIFSLVTVQIYFPTN